MGRSVWVLLLLAAAVGAWQYFDLAPSRLDDRAAHEPVVESPLRPNVVAAARRAAVPSPQVHVDIAPHRAPAPVDRSREVANGWRLLQDGDAAGAIPYFEQAADGGPADALFGLALAYQKLGRMGEALLMAHQAAAAAPGKVGPWRLLGQLLLDSGDLEGAVTAWERALLLRPDAQLTRLLETTRADLATNRRFFVSDTRHFRARFEGPAESYLAERVLDMLESAYASVGLALGYYPETVIETILYTDQAFRDVTRTPTWAGGLYDGKVRLPISGAVQNPESLRRVVTHEYTHAAVAALLGKNRIPTWLHEGVALNLEQSELDRWAHGILVRGRAPVSLYSISGSLLGLSAEQADQVYAQSYVMVKSMIDRFGMFRLADLLGAMDGSPVGDTFLATYGESPDAILQRALKEFTR